MKNKDKHLELIINSKTYTEYCINCDLIGLKSLSHVEYRDMYKTLLLESFLIMNKNLDGFRNGK